MEHLVVLLIFGLVAALPILLVFGYIWLNSAAKRPHFLPTHDCSVITDREVAHLLWVIASLVFGVVFLLGVISSLVLFGPFDGDDFQLSLWFFSVWGVFASSPFFLLAAMASNKPRKGGKGAVAKNFRAFCLSMKVGLSVASIYWAWIFSLAWLKPNESVIAGGFMVLLSPFIVGSVMLVIYRKKSTSRS